MRKVREAVRRQLWLNADKNVLHAQAAELLAIDPIFVAALEELLDSGLEGFDGVRLHAIAADAASSLIDRVLSVNQYIRIDRQARKELIAIYVESWRKMLQSRDIEATLRDYHFPQISEYIRALYPEELRDALRTSLRLGEVPSFTYSGQFQVSIFRLDGTTMKEPVLDVGCGPDGNLVHHLRSLGIDSFGLDRSIREDSSFLWSVDWFEFPFERGKWGTITANLSFTNHYGYAKRYDHSWLPIYEEKYLQILDSLSPEGAFVYAPSVAELEEKVDRLRFKTACWSIKDRYTATRVERLAL